MNGLPECMHVHHVRVWCPAHGSQGTASDLELHLLRESCEPPCQFLELNLESLQKQQVLSLRHLSSHEDPPFLKFLLGIL